MSVTSADTAYVSYGRRVSDLAAADPDGVALTFARSDGTDVPVTWGELDRTSNRTARVLAARGVGQGSMFAVCLPNSVAHLTATIAGWKLGACVLPLRADLPAWERDRVLAVAAPTLALTNWDTEVCPVLRPDDVDQPGVSDAGLPDRTAEPARAIATSGSTGTPKIIVVAERGEALPAAGQNEAAASTGQRAGQVQLVPAPLYHTNGFLITHGALFQAQSVILMERFDAARAVDLIERYGVNVMVGVTTMLLRIARLPDIENRDLSSLEILQHGGAPLPEWLADWWIDRVGAEHFFVSYGSSENAGAAVARGDAWLAHRGTVGFPAKTEVLVVDDDGNPVPTGTIGNINLRRPGQQERAFTYRGDVEPDTRPDFYTWLGDLGWLDEDGYIFLADRRKDMIISGGANVYPAEVEAALTDNPAVRDAVVVGLPDPEWGSRVHAIVEFAPGQVDPPDAAALKAHCASRLAAYKVPKSYEIVEAIPRTSAGKVRRSQLADERSVP